MKANFGFGEVFGHLVVWLLIILFTLGIGLFFFPYSFAKFLLKRTQVHTEHGVYDLKCDLDVFGQLGHIIIWIIISVLTLGLGYAFYLYGVWRIVARNTKLSRRPDSAVNHGDSSEGDPGVPGLPNAEAN